MKVLFSIRLERNARLFESLLDELATRGHDVEVVLEDAPGLAGEPLAQEQEAAGTAVLTALAERHPNLGFGVSPRRQEGTLRSRLARGLRTTLTYFFYLGDPFDGAPQLRARARRKAPGIVRRLTRGGPLAFRFGRRLLAAVLRPLERRIPPQPAVVDYLRERSPDLLLVSPLIVGQTASQLDYVRAARRLGIPSVFLVASWDNLTTKSPIFDPPDRVVVWNDAQRREAEELHGVPGDRVLVAGAHSFDHWFAWKPSTTREQFCKKVGLDPERPYLLYMCSSPLVAGPKEAAFVESWLQRIRAREDTLRAAQVLVRPHPNFKIAKQWASANGRLGEGVVVWPVPSGNASISPRALAASRADFYDSVYHSAAVVGVNTSALIEAAIMDRSVYAVRDDDLREGQQEMLHFSLIAEFAGGLLNIADSYDEHARQLAEALAGHREEEQAARRARFLQGFVRPAGLDLPAATVLADALEELVASTACR
jgi:hypothetical protein